MAGQVDGDQRAASGPSRSAETKLLPSTGAANQSACVSPSAAAGTSSRPGARPQSAWTHRKAARNQAMPRRHRIQGSSTCGTPSGRKRYIEPLALTGE